MAKFLAFTLWHDLTSPLCHDNADENVKRFRGKEIDYSYVDGTILFCNKEMK